MSFGWNSSRVRTTPPYLPTQTRTRIDPPLTMQMEPVEQGNTCENMAVRDIYVIRHAMLNEFCYCIQNAGPLHSGICREGAKRLLLCLSRDLEHNATSVKGNPFWSGGSPRQQTPETSFSFSAELRWPKRANGGAWGMEGRMSACPPLSPSVCNPNLGGCRFEALTGSRVLFACRDRSATLACPPADRLGAVSRRVRDCGTTVTLRSFLVAHVPPSSAALPCTRCQAVAPIRQAGDLDSPPGPDTPRRGRSCTLPPPRQRRILSTPPVPSEQASAPSPRLSLRQPARAWRESLCGAGSI